MSHGVEFLTVPRFVLASRAASTISSQAASDGRPIMILPLTKDVGVLVIPRSAPSWRPASTRDREA